MKLCIGKNPTQDQTRDCGGVRLQCYILLSQPHLLIFTESIANEENCLIITDSTMYIAVAFISRNPKRLRLESSYNVQG